MHSVIALIAQAGRDCQCLHVERDCGHLDLRPCGSGNEGVGAIDPR